MTVPYIFADASQNIPLAELDANFAAVANTDNIEYNPPFANSTVETVTAKLAQTVSVKDFGAVGNGITDDTEAVQAAIDSVCPVYGSGSAGSVYFPSGNYLITSVLNLTNSRQAGTKCRDGLRLYGESSASSIIVGETGSGYAIADVTGSQWLNLSNLGFQSGSKNKSTVGIYQGLASALQQTQNQRFEQIIISIHDDSTANGGNGTIALWNFGAEENTYDTCYFIANTPIVCTTVVNSPVGTYANPILAQASSHSLGVTTFSGENYAVSLGRYYSPIKLLGVNTFECENIYISNIGTGGTNDYSISFYSSCVNVNINSTIEQLGTIYVLGTIKGANVNLTFGAIANSSAPIIKLARGGEGIISYSNFKITNNDSSSSNRNIFQVIPTSSSEQVSCFLQSSTFNSNLLSGYTGLNENLLWNPNTSDVKITGVNWSYTIGKSKHSIALQNFSLGTTGTTTEICEVLMPTILSNVSAGGVGIKVEGLIGTTNYGDNSRSSGWLSSVVTLSTSQNGVKTYGTAATSWSGVSNVNASGNNITNVALTITDATVTTNVSVKLTPTITGVNNSSATFTGTVDMIWSGWSSVAPSLLLSGNSTP